MDSKRAKAINGLKCGKQLRLRPELTTARIWPGNKWSKKIAPRVAKQLATKLGAETAEKWVGRMIPLASSAIGGALNFTFVRGWGRRAQRHLRAKHLEAKLSAAQPPRTYTAA